MLRNDRKELHISVARPLESAVVSFGLPTVRGSGWLTCFFLCAVAFLPLCSTLAVFKTNLYHIFSNF
jgi:hypothetical protein